MKFSEKFKIIQYNNLYYLFDIITLKIYINKSDDFQEFLRISGNTRFRKKTFLKENQIKEIDNYLANQSCDAGINRAFGDFTSISSIVLNLTNQCTLACTYCSAYDFTENEDISFPVIKNAIDFLVQNNPQSSQYGVVFFGGEPLLKAGLIENTIRYIGEKYPQKKFFYSTTTNGTVLNARTVSLLKKNNFLVNVSLDGNKASHDKNRKYHNGNGSFDDILKNLKTLKINNVGFEFKVTFDSENRNLIDSFIFLENLEKPFSYSFTINSKYKSSSLTNYNKDKVESINRQFDKIYDYYYEKIVNNKKIYCVNIINSLSKIHNRIGKNYICTSGKNTITVNRDGSVFSCQNLVNYPETSIGSVMSDFSPINHAKFQALDVDFLNECMKCWLRYLCSGGCYAEKYIENKSIKKTIPLKCKMIENYWLHIIRFYLKITSRKDINIDHFLATSENIKIHV
ncbi:MAG: 4Fe-4S cluster-binding domain-containing protein [Alphaproteobacteria bacterium]|nr:4Fe-4S cluster-binding domain-containing protein [Alphaproteobacteria bacterium]